MHRLTVGFNDEQVEWIESRADAEGRSNAEIVRRAVDAMRTDANRTDAMHTDANRITLSRDEFDDLKERVSALEDQIGETTDTGGSADVVSTVEPRGKDAEDPVPDVVEWARANQPVTREDLLEWVAPRVDIKPQSWWKRHGRDELKDHGAEFTRNVGWRFPSD